MSTRLQQMKATLVKLVIELNIYKNETSNDRQTRYQCYATRLYIFLIIVSLIILSAYTLLNQSIYRRTVINPSEISYMFVFASQFFYPCCVLPIYSCDNYMHLLLSMTSELLNKALCLTPPN